MVPKQQHIVELQDNEPDERARVFAGIDIEWYDHCRIYVRTRNWKNSVRSRKSWDLG